LERFLAAFSELPDPRAANARHDLLEVVFIALAALLCGAKSCADMAEFGLAKQALLGQFLDLKHGVPSHDTFSRVFRLLDPVAFEAAFRRFTAAFGARVCGVVAIDGKAVRGAFERGRSATPLHLVNVWAAEQRLVLAQRTAPHRNEAAGAVEAVRLLSLEGCIVTVDALHCHAKMAKAVLERGGRYVLTLKGNQEKLRADAAQRIESARHRSRAEQRLTTSHGRQERRRAVVVRDATFAAEHGFPGVEALARIDALRRTAEGQETTQVRHFLLSQPLSAAELLTIVREHWSIESVPQAHARRRFAMN
jgi:predicted transposase YbfD/YdcC